MSQQTLPSITAAIFDMDGLLLDTEPLWLKSMLKVAAVKDIPITKEKMVYTRGLRIYEVTDYWKKGFGFQQIEDSRKLAEEILDDVIAETKSNGSIMLGVESVLDFCRQKDLKIGIATSSPKRMMDELIDYFSLRKYFDVMVSADGSMHGKPHPEVFLRCAEQLNVSDWHCLVFEDSLNGMIAAKAARMKVVVVPESVQFENPKFALADVKLKSLLEFDERIWQLLQ